VTDVPVSALVTVIAASGALYLVDQELPPLNVPVKLCAKLGAADTSALLIANEHMNAHFQAFIPLPSVVHSRIESART
jgi:hypothetical protein